VDEAVAAAVMDQMGGVHKRFVGHVSLMYRELLKAMKAELSAQAAAQQQATAQLLAQALEAQKQQIEAERTAVLAEERGNIERLLTAISATLNRDLPARLQEAVRGELSSIGDTVAASVTPAVQAALTASLPKELSSAVKAGLDKQLAPTVAASLSGKPLQEAFRSAFAKQLVPAFEAATQAMFQQIQSAFAAGFEEHLQATRTSLAEPAKLASQLAASLSSAQSLAASLNQGQQQLLRAQSIGGAPSGALSPAAQVDVRGELSSLLRSHQYEQAFSRALGLQDVSTVGWLCTQADAAAVLSRDPCPLSQMVLLSLVQQLSADLTASLAAKLAWIREAALQLNPKDPVLARHLRPVLEGVHTALAAAAARATGPDAASCRLALHVVHSQMTS
jgi:enhancer of mRNA-decapping protein 4